MRLALLLVTLLLVNVNAESKCVTRTGWGGSHLFMRLRSDTMCRSYYFDYSCYLYTNTPGGDSFFCRAYAYLTDSCVGAYASWSHNFDEPPRHGNSVRPTLRMANGQNAIRRGDRITLDVTMTLEPGSTIQGLPEVARLIVNGVFDKQREGGDSCHYHTLIFQQPNCTRYVQRGSNTDYLNGVLDIKETQVLFHESGA